MSITLGGAAPAAEQSAAVAQHSDVPAGDGSAADPLYDHAVTVVRTQRRASISLVQRHLTIGYNRAARLIEAMEVAGVIAGTQGVYTLLPAPGIST
ncbi:MAG: DNA translocase FtsK [Pseudomonadota bacterium]